MKSISNLLSTESWKKWMNRSVEGPALQTTYNVLFGLPAKVIVDHAKHGDDAMIVIATQGLTGLERTILGSVAERVVRLANVPVITVKHPLRKGIIDSPKEQAASEA